MDIYLFKELLLGYVFEEQFQLTRTNRDDKSEFTSFSIERFFLNFPYSYRGKIKEFKMIMRDKSHSTICSHNKSFKEYTKSNISRDTNGFSDAFFYECLQKSKPFKEFCYNDVKDVLEPVVEAEVITESIEEKKLTLENLFCDKNDIERCLNVLRELEKPVITADNKYIGKNKGIFPLWIRILQSHKPKSLVKILTDKHYAQILNDSFEGLNLSKDASEFRKTYMTLEKSTIRHDLMALLARN